MPTNGDAGRAGLKRSAATSSPRTVGVGASSAWNRADLTRDWPATAVASAIAILPALLLAQVPLPVALAAGVAIGLGLALWAGRTSAAPLVLSFVPATILANSGLMPATTYYLPTATLGLSLVMYAAASFARTRSIPALPAKPLIAWAVLYVAGAVVATVFSIRPGTSVPYLIGIVIILVVTLWLGPLVLSDSIRTASLFALIGAAGLVVTGLSFLFSLTGPILWFGRWLGVYLVDELTLGGDPTGISLLRTSGPFLAPGGQALAVVPAILALLALRSGLGRPGRITVDLALVILTAGLLSTFTRAGWLAVIVGSALMALHDVRLGRINLAAAAVCAVTAVAFVALLMNVVGADYRPDLTVARISASGAVRVDQTGEGPLDAIPVIPEPGSLGGSSAPESSAPRFQTRGGAELSGRLELWSASVRAIEESPWVGYGPGTNAMALDPFLTGVSRRFVGLTSHNTWLRTWIELGILGFLGFAGFVIAALVGGVRRRSPTPVSQSIRMGLVAIFVGLLAAQGFETFLLGGVSMPSFVWSMAAGLLALPTEGRMAREAVTT